MVTAGSISENLIKTLRSLSRRNVFLGHEWAAERLLWKTDKAAPRGMVSLRAKLSHVLRVLDTDLHDFRWYQAPGLLGKVHHAVGVHQDLDGPWRRAPAL